MLPRPAVFPRLHCRESDKLKGCDAKYNKSIMYASLHRPVYWKVVDVVSKA